MRTSLLPRTSECGAALLLALLVLLVGSLSLLVGRLSTVEARQAADRTSHAALARARDALVGRAATDANRPGSLPCPAVDETGQAAGFSGNNCPTYIGRFPWKSLRTGELRDGYGELLWYALAPALRDHNAAGPINSQTAPQLTLDGQANVAAIVFSPGPPQASQSGRPGDTVADYLDGSNADGDQAYASGPPSATFNDHAAPITRDELFSVVGKRVLAELRGPDDNAPAPPNYGLRRYHSDFVDFPWADSGTDGHANTGTASGRVPYKDLQLEATAEGWLRDNNWLDLVTYERLSSTSARLKLGSTQFDIRPCPTSPCP